MAYYGAIFWLFLLFAQAIYAAPRLSLDAHPAPTAVATANLTTLGAHTKTTLPGPGTIHTNIAEADFPAFLDLCFFQQCQSCVSIDLSMTPADECIATSLYHTAFIQQTSNSGLDFAVFAAMTDCDELAQLTAVNTCFSLPDEALNTYTNYAIVK
ncbi:hypothetical protein C8Q79DRAFT_1010836 [Trametes meyenii]|nr:hypothetical protein C8Q79DRAFT_1010836 [Trametes meyenii]